MKAVRLQAPLRMAEHIQHASGKWKTVCVTACLTALGVPFDSFQVTGTLSQPNYMSILNRHGLSARSRKSYMPKGATVGACRAAIKKLGEDCHYMLVIKDAPAYHMILVDNQGNTVVDTAPRKADKRKVVTIHAVGRA